MTVLRPARSTDAGAVGSILSEFIDTTDWMPRVHTRTEDIAHAGELIRRGWVTVAEHQGEVVGFAACSGGELNALYVAKSMRGNGIGSALVGALKRAQDVLVLWTFERNTRGQAFYLAHGFVEVARTEGSGNDEKLPDIQYHWQRRAL